MDLSLSRLYIKINGYKLLNILSIIFIDTGVPIPNKPACIMMPMKIYCCNSPDLPAGRQVAAAPELAEV